METVDRRPLIINYSLVTAVAATLVVTAAVATATAAIAATSAATLSGDDVDECLDLLLGSIMHAQHLTFESKSHTSIGVVEVDGNGILLHLYHEAVHALTLSIHERNYVTRINLLIVKLAVHAEDILVYINNILLVAVAIGLVLGEGKVKGVALLQIVELLFESLEGKAQSGSELEGMLGGSLFYKFFLTVKHGVHIVGYDNRFARINFCHIRLFMINFTY